MTIAQKDLQAARALLRGARRVVVSTGAGMSAESGIPTFRGDGGLWRKFRAEELATPEAFGRDPALVWEWYAMRRGFVADAQPHAGHAALVAFEIRHRAAHGDDAFAIVTQNVDGLHQRAGSQRVRELHGCVWRVRCVDCGVKREDRRLEIAELPPRCVACGGIERPDIVWFGEALPREVFEDAADDASRCDAMLVCGTSAVVYPAAGLVDTALAHGADIIEVNPQATPFSDDVTIALAGPAGEVLPLLLAE